jgi:hypothetical protein
MKEFIKKMLSSSDDVSIKRIIGVLAFISLDVIAFINLFTGKVILNFIFDGILYICLTCLGLTVIEKFSDSFNKR